MLGEELGKAWIIDGQIRREVGCVWGVTGRGKFNAIQAGGTILDRCQLLAVQSYVLPTRPSPCNPSTLLKITSKVLGNIPALPSLVPPWTL